MSTPESAPGLRNRDFLLLLLYGLALFSFPLAFGRTLSTHETVHCLNIREMRLDGDWIIPHYGGRPWLERPPLPFWLTVPIVAVLGDGALAYRLAPVLVALPCILLCSWIAALWFGRGVGLLSGLILATIREFTHYAVAPECDMFLCGVVTAALALFVHLEFRSARSPDEQGFLLGRRPKALLGFFCLLGLANLVKGLFFGDLLILTPVACWLLLGPDRWAMVRRYLWLPGWLAFAAVGSAWGVAAWLHYPDIVDLWKSDYVGRLNEGYMRESAWYYPVHLPWVLFPWGVAAAVGLYATRARALRCGRTPERFLWCWALAPVVVLSVPEGKHHHYLLHALVPWAVLAGLGARRILEYLPTVRWLRTPWAALLCLGLPGEAALLLIVPRYLTPPGFLPLALLLHPLVVFALWWVASRPDMVRGFVALFALLLAGHWAGHLHPVLVEKRYAGDLAFLEQVREQLPEDAPLMVLASKGPLDASWLLYYLEGRAALLHNLTFLRDKRLPREVYLIGRGSQLGGLPEYGAGDRLAQSARSHDQAGPDDRYVLHRVRLHDHLARCDGAVYISPMQATGRTLGPELPASDSGRAVTPRPGRPWLSIRAGRESGRTSGK
jgi:4-amino-4-deoxy-L-arabinose transferase-like glycosyltransferase